MYYIDSHIPLPQAGKKLVIQKLTAKQVFELREARMQREHDEALKDGEYYLDHSKNQRNRYPFYKMNIGDSFEVLSESKMSIQAARVAASLYGNAHNMKFTSRARGQLLRVWRIA